MPSGCWARPKPKASSPFDERRDDAVAAGSPRRVGGAVGEPARHVDLDLPGFCGGRSGDEELLVLEDDEDVGVVDQSDVDLNESTARAERRIEVAVGEVARHEAVGEVVEGFEVRRETGDHDLLVGLDVHRSGHVEPIVEVGADEPQGAEGGVDVAVRQEAPEEYVAPDSGRHRVPLLERRKHHELAVGLLLQRRREERLPRATTGPPCRSA